MTILVKCIHSKVIYKTDCHIRQLVITNLNYILGLYAPENFFFFFFEKAPENLYRYSYIRNVRLVVVYMDRCRRSAIRHMKMLSCGSPF
jgi:hypothetical protein